MKIRSTIDLTQGAYHVQVGPTESSPFTAREEEALNDFGEPVVDCGGAFTGLVSFTLPARQLRFPSQFPTKQVFPCDADPDANSKAVIYRTTLETRIQTAMQQLLAKDPGTTGSWETTIATT